jgi:hypothetical protein
VSRRASVKAVYLEVGSTRVFACSLDWPGWCRSGRSEEQALEALAAYVPRYEVVVEAAGLTLPTSAGKDFEVVERVPGSGATDFGALGKHPRADLDPITAQEADRQLRLVAAAWKVFDDVVARAPAELRKGPRGGGRDRDKIADHVHGAETSYARMVGLKLNEPARDDGAMIAANREAILGALRHMPEGRPVREKGWPLRYAVRRIAWHVLDHAWEIEDKSEPAPG